jgi:hypothetical protein
MGVFWGERRIAAGAPGAHRPPAHPFGLQDAADLAAAGGDALSLGGSGQRVWRPLCRLLGIGSDQGAVGLADKPPGRVAAGQGDDAATVQFTQPSRPARAGQVAQAVDAAVVEAVQPAVDGAWVAAELGGDLADLGAVPAQVTMRARSSQLAGAWRAAASCGRGAPRWGRRVAGRTAAAAWLPSCVTRYATHQGSHPPTSD